MPLCKLTKWERGWGVVGVDAYGKRRQTVRGPNKHITSAPQRRGGSANICQPVLFGTLHHWT